MENNNDAAAAVRREVSATAITIDKVYAGAYQKEGTITAQLRQAVTTTAFYPSKQITNSLQENPFQMTDFGFEEKEFANTENRVAWIDVPVGVTSDDVLGRIAETACLYRIMSNRPILSDNQVYSIEVGLKTMDDYADSQVVKFGNGHENAGQIILDTNGKPQYRAIFYSNTAKADVEMRTEIANDFYASAQISAELLGAHTVAGQTL